MIMVTLLHILQGIVALMALGLLSSFTASRHIGLLLGAITFGAAAVGSFLLMAWWPLAVGFGAAWVLSKMGLDPGTPR